MIYEDVDFGPAFAGLSGVGYQVTDTTGTIAIARTTSGVFALGNGMYAANIALPEGFVGTIKWDTGSNVFACSRIEAPSVAADAAANAWLDQPNGIEAGLTPRQAIRGLVAMLFGQAADARSLYEHFKNPAGTITRITITADENGNRSSVSLNL